MKYREIEYKKSKNSCEIFLPEHVKLEYDDKDKSLWKKTLTKDKDEVKITMRFMDMPCEYQATEDRIKLLNIKNEEQMINNIYYIIDQLLD